jgi:hypothetical protein
MPGSASGPRSWPCGDEQKKFIELLRSQVNTCSWISELPTVRDSLWIARPDHPEGLRRGGAPKPGPFYLKPVGLWITHKAFGFMPYCPNGRRADEKRCKWGNRHVRYIGFATSPRRVLSLVEHWYLDSGRYECLACKTAGTSPCTFQSTHPDSIAASPPWLQLEFGLLMTKKHVLDNTATRFFVDNFNKLSERAIADAVSRWHYESFYGLQLKYW